MVSYIAPNQFFLKNTPGTDASVIAAEFAKIDAAIDTSKLRFAELTGGLGTDTALATSGVGIASGTDAQYYSRFVAPQAVTIVGMATYLTEAYLKDTTDAKIELLDEAAAPVTKVTYTLPTSRAVKSLVITTPASAALAAGSALDLKITATKSSTGTGHARVVLIYTVN
ncbi:MAG: hypothetical protein WC102_06280 [Saccharofermentanales bacterium]